MAEDSLPYFEGHLSSHLLWASQVFGLPILFVMILKNPVSLFHLMLKFKISSLYCNALVSLVLQQHPSLLAFVLFMWCHFLFICFDTTDQESTGWFLSFQANFSCLLCFDPSLSFLTRACFVLIWEHRRILTTGRVSWSSSRLFADDTMDLSSVYSNYRNYAPPSFLS